MGKQKQEGGEDGEVMSRWKVKKLTVTFSSFSFPFSSLFIILLVIFSINSSPASALPKAQQPQPQSHQQQQQQEDYKYSGSGTDASHLELLESGVNVNVDGLQLSHGYAHNSHEHDQNHEQHDGPAGTGSMSGPGTGSHSHLQAGNSNLSAGNCRLPDNWKGRWFQSGVQHIISITSKSMETKGTCYESSGDKFLFIEQQNNCHRCIVINERHPNILQYKESVFCEDKDILENLCSKIPGDAQLYSLFRLNATPEECPFRGAPFTFTYNRGYGECKNPVSHVDTCTESTRLLLRYQACPDVQKTESTEEELQCLAQWREGSQHYLVGKVHHRLSASYEDSYRCFVFEKMKSSGPGGHVVGYKVAQSGDATCSGVSSPTEGARTLVFTKSEPSTSKCKFPAWFSTHHWFTLDGKMSVKSFHKNTTLHVLDDARRNVSMLTMTSGYKASNPSPYDRTSLMSSFMTGGSRISCQNIKEFSERHVAVLANHLVGCKRHTVCMHIYKRDRHVVEIQLSEVTGSGSEDDFACNGAKTINTDLPFVTLVSADTAHHRCPYLGKYMATGMTQDGRVVRDSCSSSVGQAGNFNTLVVGCGDRATMEFLSNCPNQEPSTSFACHGNWEDSGTGFLIASPLSRSSTTARRYCFVYTSASEGGGLQVTSSSESCQRKVNPGAEGTWAFNLTIEGQCAEAVTAGAVQIQSAVIPTLLTLSALLLLTLLPQLCNSTTLVSSLSSVAVAVAVFVSPSPATLSSKVWADSNQGQKKSRPPPPPPPHHHQNARPGKELSLVSSIPLPSR